MKTPTKETLVCMLLIVCSIVLQTTNLQAQIEFKLNPVSFFTQEPNGAIEMLLHDKIGLEATAIAPIGRYIEYDYDEMETNVFAKSGYHIQLATKYYFKPKTKGDNFYLSAFAKSRLTNYQGGLEFFDDNQNFKETSFESGLQIGFKKIFLDQFTFEVNGGFGAEFAGKKDYLNVNYEDEIYDTKFGALGNIIFGYRLKPCKKKEIDEALPN